MSLWCLSSCYFIQALILTCITWSLIKVPSFWFVVCSRAIEEGRPANIIPATMLLPNEALEILMDTDTIAFFCALCRCLRSWWDLEHRKNIIISASIWISHGSLGNMVPVMKVLFVLLGNLWLCTCSLFHLLHPFWPYSLQDLTVKSSSTGLLHSTLGYFISHSYEQYFFQLLLVSL